MGHTITAVHAWATGSKGQTPEPNSRGTRRVRHSKRRDVFFQKALSCRRRTRRELFLSFAHLIYLLLPHSRTPMCSGSPIRLIGSVPAGSSFAGTITARIARVVPRMVHGRRILGQQLIWKHIDSDETL
uniref:Uncharacterized protein n=1 Tax=Saccharum officinarum TaxID=4547 RepID=A0A678TH18_SACOF|nr:hypothetical protein SO47N09_000008 [Saccharum officinarum]